jgi:predicted component of type VI protein secretion system
MRYALRIVRGRSNAKMLKLIDGVTSLGRHDDCLIRVRSSQVSRRHCEIYEHDGTLMIRDLDSSNGTFVNGKRVLGQQALSPGDVLTIGTVTLSVDLLRPARERIQTPPVAAQKSQDTPEMKPTAKGHDREPLEAIEDEELEVVEDDEEFEVAIDDEPQHPDLIPLEDEKATSPSTDSPKPAVAAATKAAQAHQEQSKSPRTETNFQNQASEPESSPADDDAVAQFLMDLKLDDD